MSTRRVVIVGSFNIDHVWQCDALPKPGETLSGSYRTGPGGKGFNQAIAARRAGADAMFVCALGEDAGAQLARSLAERDGLELLAKRSDAPTGTAGIYVDAAGRNSIVIGPGANAALDAELAASLIGAAGANAVVLTQLEIPGDTVLHALRGARAAGATALLNPAPANVTATAEQLSSCDVLTPNETEFAALCAAHLGRAPDASAIASMADAELHALCLALLPNGTVVVTLGEAGCFVSHAGGAQRGDDAAHYRAAAVRVRAIDTTGAGDAFNGALAASLASRQDVPFRTHIDFASAFAARSTQAEGAAEAMPYMTPADG